MLKSLIIDDEPSARARLARMLAAHPEAVSLIGEARDPTWSFSTWRCRD
jgi:DNA-binding LytR/AlgR family response regulator